MISRTNGHGHRRSLSAGRRSVSPERIVTKAKSTNDLAKTKSAQAAYGASASAEALPESNFNTLRDPRLVTHLEESESSSPPSQHPDLNDEVAALSIKLVQAINNQTTLDDKLAVARQDLEDARLRIQGLELENRKYRRDIDEQVVVKKADTDYEILTLKASLAEERARRMDVEKEKKTIEQELETLTASLFEEANKVLPRPTSLAMQLI